MQYERTSSIERAEDGAEAGLISGILATDGEASDGHILNMKGVKLPERAPLLFGHDDYTGTGNLGSWTGFHKFSDGDGLGGSGIRGTAQIELSGEGSQAAWRADIAHMIEKGHIGQFSVRWEEIGEPVARVNLPSDHPAYVDAKKANGRQRWGLYFDQWRLLEGSVVTLGADPAALVGRLTASQGDVRTFWRRAVNHALEECVESDGLVGVHLPGDEIAYVERAVYDAMLELANERCQVALDLYEELHEKTMQLALGAEQRVEITDTPGKEHDVPGSNGSGGDSRPALELDARELEFPTAVEALTQDLLKALERSDERWESGLHDLVKAATGKL